MALDLDLTLASTMGNYRLPLKKDVFADLGDAGFTDIYLSHLIPGQPLFAIRAIRPG